MEKKENWFKTHPKTTIGLIIFMFLVGIGGFIDKQKSCDLADFQKPNAIIFSNDYKVVNTWKDGTNITTLKDYNKITPDGVLTKTEFGDFQFYLGNKPGQNVNEYYIESNMFNAQLMQLDKKDAVFYLEYNKNGGTDENGNILKDIHFKLIPEKYQIEKKEDLYYMTLLDYRCNNGN